MAISDASNGKTPQSDRLKLHGFSMIRNEADVMEGFVRQAATLFDRFTFVDVSSTDGTEVMLAKSVAQHGKQGCCRCAKTVSRRPPQD